MRNLLAALFVVLFANGCMFLPWGSGGWSDDDDWVDYGDVHEIDAQVEDAWLAGDMADLGEFEGDAYEVTYYGGYGASTITLHAGEDGGEAFGWAMAGLTTYDEGGFEGDTFAPGQTVSMEDGQLDIQGCTGPSHGNYLFDGHAQDIEVTVEEGPTPGSRLFHFRAVFEVDNGGVTEGSFILIPDNTGSTTGTVNG